MSDAPLEHYAQVCHQLAIKAAMLMGVLVLMCLMTCRETDSSVQGAPAKKQKQDTGVPVAVSC